MRRRRGARTRIKANERSPGSNRLRRRTAFKNGEKTVMTNTRTLPWIASSVLALGTALATAGEARKPERRSSPKKTEQTEKTEKSAAENGKPAPVPPVADKKTTALLDRAEARAYLLGKEGVRRASCKGEAVVKVENEDPVKVGFHYEWDGTVHPPQGKLEVDPGAEALTKYVPGTDVLNGFFWVYSWREEYAGCRLAAEGGDRAKISVDGKSKLRITSLLLNADGMPEEVNMAIPGEIKVFAPDLPDTKVKVSYAKTGEKFVQSLFNATLGAGTLADIRIEYAKSGKYSVPVKLRLSMAPPGEKSWNTEATIGEWKLEDAEKASPAKADRDKDSENRAGQKKPASR
jgi:hypothetical protein